MTKKRFEFKWNLKVVNCVWVALIVGSLSTLDANAAYTQASVATVGAMTSQTVATAPSNRSRTTLGIGEEVTCSIPTGTWSDTDCNASTNTIEVDTIGTITWSVSSGGTLSSSTGASTVLTAEISATPPSPTVTATIKDSQSKYNDTTITKNMIFTIAVPSGVTVTAVMDDYSHWSTRGNAYVGCSTLFDLHLTPLTVNFYNVSFREDVPAYTYTWSDGSTDPTAQHYVTYAVTTNPSTGIHYGFLDLVDLGLKPVTALVGLPATSFLTFTIPIPHQFQNDGGIWVLFLAGTDNTHIKSFDRSTNEGRSSVQGASSTVHGGWIGPFK